MKKILDRGVIKRVKICPTCNREFTERKKWNFDEVIYCSKKCRYNKK